MLPLYKIQTAKDNAIFWCGRDQLIFNKMKCKFAKNYVILLKIVIAFIILLKLQRVAYDHYQYLRILSLIYILLLICCISGLKKP